MKIICSAAALLATALVASSTIAAEPTGTASDAVVSACKRHMIGLGPNYEPHFRLCAYISGTVNDVRDPADPQQDDQDLATIRSFTQSQPVNPQNQPMN